MNAIFDAHFHVIDHAFPLQENQGFLPEPFTATQYQQQAQKLNINAGAIVSGSFQGFDQSYLIAALKILGDNFVGVTQLAADVSDQDILDLDQVGVRAVRFNLKRGGSADRKDIKNLGQRVYDVAGWHTELYVDSVDLPQLQSTLLSLPAVSIDHLGLTANGLPTLLSLVAQGVKVKATGFGRVMLDVLKVMQAIYAINPSSLLFGTDLPSTRAKRPFHENDILLIQEHFTPEAASDILFNNANAFYSRRAIPSKTK